MAEPATKKAPKVESPAVPATAVEANQKPQPDGGYKVADPVMRKLIVERSFDMATVGGLVISNLLIFGALAMGGNVAAFFNIPSLLIVLFGTLGITFVCFSGSDIQFSWPIIKRSFYHSGHNPTALARLLVDMSIVVRKRGTLALTGYEAFWKNDPLLYPYIAMVVDGYSPQEIENMAAQELETALEGYRRASSMCRRAAEFAPGMGLIGTLVGLVQMLGQLQAPETLGPSMAIALLTTFYGALIGTVLCAPLANKIERNANREANERQMILSAACAMAVIENPRRIEMMLNSFLPREQKLSFLTKEFE